MNRQKPRRNRYERSALEMMLKKKVQVVTGDGRVFVGFLKGVDQTLNAVLDNCVERVYSKDHPVKEIRLGLYIIRGELVSMIGELDEVAENEIDLGGITAAPIPPLKKI